MSDSGALRRSEAAEADSSLLVQARLARARSAAREVTLSLATAHLLVVQMLDPERIALGHDHASHDGWGSAQQLQARSLQASAAPHGLSRPAHVSKSLQRRESSAKAFGTAA